MKTNMKNLFLLSALVAGLGLILAGRVAAQTLTTLHSFTVPSGTEGFYGTNSDGVYPEAGLILSGNTLYGAAYGGGSGGSGTVFAVNTDGTGFTTLHSFSFPAGGYTNNVGIFVSTNSDGKSPDAGLILSGTSLYGAAAGGGSGGSGTVFAVNTDGTGFTNLHSFTATTTSTSNSDGAGPEAVLVLSGNTLYGTTLFGGSSGSGVVFAVNTDGTGFTNLHSFTATSAYPDALSGTNSDGAVPYAGVILSGNTLYGTASAGGSGGSGTVFAINTDGTGFTNLYSFTALSSAPYFDNGTNNDGAAPRGELVFSGNTLYGITWFGGSSGDGTVFAVNTNGMCFRTVHIFTGTSDEGVPLCRLTLSGNTLYGTTSDYRGSGSGTVFAVNTDGTGFTTLHSFTATNEFGDNNDGAHAWAGVILSCNTLCGTADGGGSSGHGTVFSLSFAPQLNIILSGANVILTWPTNVAGFSYAGFTLQSTTNLSPAAWSTNLPAPVIVNGQYTVTNPISGTQQFFQLSQTPIPGGMALIRAGAFTMGDTLDGESDAIPISVTASGFYMDTNLVSYSQWQSVYSYATSNGYGFDDAGSAKGNAVNHPVQTVDWYDVVKWSNARSQQAGLTPVYYTDTNLTQVYTNEEVPNIYVNWAANGYRLPTEAEWEKAARGGLSGLRFPWGDTISESQANYYGDTNVYSYDLGPNGYNAVGEIGGLPYTSPVGYFAANGYGLYDMAGNVFEWCWDWYATPYGQPTRTNPTGPASGSLRVLRGGDWGDFAFLARCALRSGGYPVFDYGNFGFRCVRGL